MQTLSASPLLYVKRVLIFIISLAGVAWGQPTGSLDLSLFASCIGYGLFFELLCLQNNPKKRFWLATLWFFGVQLIQLSWLISHPYLYIYFVYLFLSFAIGLQFGLIGYFIEPRRVTKLSWIMGLSGLWVILEWSRLFVLSGFSFNPVGLALTANIYSMQFASLFGVYGLSFWVIMVNLLVLKLLLEGFRWKWVILSFAIAALPFFYGWMHLNYHEPLSKNSETLTAVLVQPSFPAEEALKITDHREFFALILKEWTHILSITKKQLGKPIDVIILPEAVLPYGTYSFVYPFFAVKKAFLNTYGVRALPALPALENPLAFQQETAQGKVWMVNNAYWIQAIANLYESEVVAGLEDAEDTTEGEREFYSCAVHVLPQQNPQAEFISHRYEKRVLVPMGEYIPFSFLNPLAKKYGLSGSFTHGKEAKIFQGKKKMGLSICYEETYGHLMRENKQKGAEILLNLTSDIWYPNSTLIYQHFDLARLRTIENGIPLLRACNTGVTAALDSFGQVVAQLGEPSQNIELISDSLRVTIPLYSYQTLYTIYGDWIIIVFSLLSIGACVYINNKDNKL